MKPETLTTLLDLRKSGLKGITFIEPTGKDEFLSYGDLYDAALKVLGLLQRRGISPGDELVLQLQENRVFLIAFWACMLGGIIPVPLSPGAKDDHRHKLFNVWEILNNPYMMVSQPDLQKLGVYAREQGMENSWLAMCDNAIDTADLNGCQGVGVVKEVLPSDTAFIQFSSGSTGSPKGVVLTHGNLICNIDAIAQASAYTEDDATFSWMPLTHDMGLIGFHLSPMFSGMDQYIMPTQSFVRRPAGWLEKANEYKATVLCSPNFGYRYFLKHVHDQHTGKWDLSGVRIIYNGAEPVSERLCAEFLDKCAAYGVRRSAMCPVYGLAEASLAVTISGMADQVVSLCVDRRQLNDGDQVALIAPGDSAVTLVNVGKPVKNCSLRITDRQDMPVPAGTVGHIHIKGDNVTCGYYNNQEATACAITADGWLRTGDLGFMLDGCLYITGREKDIIFVNGQNFYPADIEQIAEDVEGIELNKIAVAGHFNSGTQREECIAFVFHRGDISDFISIAQALKTLVGAKAGIELDRVVPVKDIPRTTSGKLQRFRLLELYREGAFADVMETLEQAASPGEVNRFSVDGYERKLLDICEKIFGEKWNDVHRNFFEAGLSSLKVAELSLLAAKAFNTALPADFIYTKQTVRELAAAIRQNGENGYQPIPAGIERPYCPLSSSQRRMYYFWQLNKSTVTYNLPAAFRIRGSVQHEKLEQGIKDLIARHDMLRAVFSMDPVPSFIVKKTTHFTLEKIVCAPDQVSEALRELVQPFDLGQGPLFRAKLLHTDAEECYLFLDFHHIIADGVSISLFVKTLMEYYNGEGGTPSSLRYSDFVQWEEDNRLSGKLREHAGYWQQQLQGDLPVLSLPADFQRPPVLSTEGGKIAFEAGKELTEQLRALARRMDCSLHVLLFSVYTVFLSKITGQDELVIGIPVSGRRHPDLLEIQGMFVNNLAVRCHVSGEDTFVRFLEKQQQHVAEALHHQDYPFDDLVRQIAPDPDSSRNPVFDTMFLYQNMELPVFSNNDFTLTPWFFDNGTSKYDISMEVFEDGPALRCFIEYSAKLFRKETMAAFADGFLQLARRAVSNGTDSIADWSMLSETEFERYVRKYNATGREYAAGSGIHRLFEEQVWRTPSSIAVEHGNTTYSFHELNEQADRVAGWLKEQGVGQDAPVAILLPATPELLVSILAVLKAGGYYLPLEPGWPAERVRYVLESSRCRLLICDESNKDRNVYPGVANLYIKEVPPAAPKKVLSVSDPDHLSYVLYTSGTTGRPKGVMITHRSLINYTCWAAESYIRGAQVTMPLYTSVSFDLTLTSIFTPLITGNRIVIYGEDGDNLSLVNMLTDNKCDVIKATPSHLRIMAAGKWLEKPGSRVRRIIVGGEQLDTGLAREIYEQAGGNIEIYNEYGPTEATVGCMIHLFNPEELTPQVPIGVPAANSRIYLLDKYRKPVACGVYGEIYIAGGGLAKGYLADEALTREKFVEDPFHAGERMYKTGDIGRRLPDGTVVFLGRSDEQVKLNGHRIELREIEQCLKQHPDVDDTIVTVTAGLAGVKLLCAYIRWKAGSVGRETALRFYLAERLPYYMLPSCIIEIGEIPLTANGKADLKALPQPENMAAPEQSLPTDAAAAALIEAWEEVLETPVRSVRDNFYASGGDSIKAVQIASRLLGRNMLLKARDILTYHTIEHICPHIGRTGAENKYEQGIISGEREMTPAEGWFFEQAFENPHYFNQSVLLRLKRPVNHKLLEQAFSHVVQHHDGLRMNYDPERKTLFYNPAHLDTRSIVEKYSIGDVGGDGLTTIYRKVKGTFDITGSLLLKGALFSFEAGESLLLITAHHLVTDGVSWRIILEDLYHGYTALENGREVVLPEKTAPLAGWREKLIRLFPERALSPVIENSGFTLPLDVHTHDWRMINRREIVGGLDAAQTGVLLKDAYRFYESDMLVLLSAALLQTLHEWTGKTVVVVEYESHGRHPEMPDTSRTVGWLTEMYPQVLELPATGIDGLLKAVKDQVQSGMCWGTRYNAHAKSEIPQTAVRFNYLGQFSKELENDLFSFCGLSTDSDSDPGNSMTARVELLAMILNGKLIMQLHYNHQAHFRSTMQALMDRMQEHVRSIAAHISHKKDLTATMPAFDTAGLDDQEINDLLR